MTARKNLPLEVQSEFANIEKWFARVHFFETDFEFGSELKAKLKERIEKPENLLGEGGIGSVIDLGNGTCIKLMENRENSPNKDMLDLGNNTKTEAELQAQLDGFESEGVYSPHVYGYYTGERGAAIIMEKINAVNLQDVISGKEKLPENFTKDFFDQLEGYVQDMNMEKRIAHGDLFPRNILVNRETGGPVVIDFGRAVKIKGDNPGDSKLAVRDLKMVEAIRDKFAEHIAKNQKTP